MSIGVEYRAFIWVPYVEQWFWPDSKMEQNTSETQGWKEY